MKTKTTDGTTVVVATERERRTLDQAIDVLIEYKAREPYSAHCEVATAAHESLMKVIQRLVPLGASPENPAAKSDPKPTKPVPPEIEVIKEDSVTPSEPRARKSAK